ncbi:hypothetical protein PVAND_004878 [Polypedilum vanderplanki]|uniref:Uncharacterized protein n=1 Tax=Polypedilum vanderplanki TaxID=319348 RepID=A0A9J6C0D4_POLVA|nr:hypothetical protein PVAND_004878 [Polypedilum vanderplanki]
MRFFSITSSLRLFTSQTSIHGIRYSNEPQNHKFVRIFWLIVFIISIAGLVYYAKTVYYKWKIAPDISTMHQLKPIHEIPFPAITICSPVSINNEHVNYQYAYTHIQYMNHSHIDELPNEEQKILSAMSQSCNPSLSTEFVNHIKHTANQEIVNYLNNSSFSINEAFLLCLLVNNTKKNCTELISRVVTDYGICYVYNLQDFNSIFNDHVITNNFNHYNHHKTIDWTLENGYKTEFENAYPHRIISDSSVEFILKIPKNQTYNFCPQMRNSYKIIFHMPNEIPTKFHDYFFSSVGSQFFISMEASFYSHDNSLRDTSPEMRQCYFDGERKLKFFKSYTKAHCDLECLTNFTMKVCNCVKFSMPRMNNTPVCDLIDASCYNLVFRQWPHNDEISINQQMPCNCFPTCSNIKYNTKLIDHINIDDSFNRDVTERKKATNDSEIFTAIVIVFEDFLITKKIGYVGYKLENFIAEIGGLLGLFMGSSLLSIVEMFYLCIKGIIQKRKKKIALRLRFFH